MRMPYYEQIEKQHILRVAARAWIGTPFRKGACDKGIGVDCVNLAKAVYHESGFELLQPFPRYRLDEGAHSSKSKVLDWLHGSERFDFVPVNERQNGDLLLFNMGASVHHVGVQITETTFINAIKRYGVVELNIHDSTWAEKLSGVFRPMEIYFSPA